MDRTRTVFTAFVAAALIGIGIFGVLAWRWRSVTVRQADSAEARDTFRDVLDSLPSPDPLVSRDASGRFVRHAPTGRGATPTQLHVLAYYADGEQLIRADVPLWFFELKGFPVAYALRGTGFDLDALTLNARDLERAGAGVVLDEQRSTGDRLLAWTN